MRTLVCPTQDLLLQNMVSEVTGPIMCIKSGSITRNKFFSGLEVSILANFLEPIKPDLVRVYQVALMHYNIRWRVIFFVFEEDIYHTTHTTLLRYIPNTCRLPEKRLLHSTANTRTSWRYIQDNNTLWSLRAEESNWKCRHRGCLREHTVLPAIKRSCKILAALF